MVGVFGSWHVEELIEVLESGSCSVDSARSSFLVLVVEGSLALPWSLEVKQVEPFGERSVIESRSEVVWLRLESRRVWLVFCDGGSFPEVVVESFLVLGVVIEVCVIGIKRSDEDLCLVHLCDGSPLFLENKREAFDAHFVRDGGHEMRVWVWEGPMFRL